MFLSTSAKITSTLRISKKEAYFTWSHTMQFISSKVSRPRTTTHSVKSREQLAEKSDLMYEVRQSKLPQAVTQKPFMSLLRSRSLQGRASRLLMHAQFVLLKLFKAKSLPPLFHLKSKPNFVISLKLIDMVHIDEFVFFMYIRFWFGCLSTVAPACLVSCHPAGS
ncbi:unnamed protein product [Lepeophtheirus salmonis]|uniref:(salmon louse) hypothetical protein n=1 Tax=Lepeophtheirus salmonis TaxID=72036 RepID=A0A7R8H4Q3_LEPSM|nr:unnamed protein product [Lepeophtheirus salmonis]CAF2863289.1 unnamed protein product [Lepeophtheirus salmonis]